MVNKDIPKTADPEEIANYLCRKGMEPFKEPVCIGELINDPLKRVSSGTTGLEMDPNFYLIAPYDYNEQLKPFLADLNYGTWIEEYHDCEDRAFWGMAHLRHRFPGVPVGVASSKAKKHAVMILWVKPKGKKTKPESVFWDPAGPDQDEFGKIDSIVAFPPSKKPENTPPVTNGLSGMLVYDERRIVYHRDDILSYLKNELYENDCTDIGAHSITYKTYFNMYWKRSSADRALWAFVHIRRRFPGCPIGVAMKNSAGGLHCVTILYYKKDDDKSSTGLEFIYVDTSLSKPTVVEFNPTMIFI